MAKRQGNYKDNFPHHRGEKHYRWTGEEVSVEGGRLRCRAIYLEIGTCEICGAKATDRHHKDANTANNSPENIAFLCRRCHMTEDGRLEALRKSGLRPREILPPKPCSNCDVPSKPLRRGLCHTCNEYQRRHGHPRPVNVDGTLRLPDYSAIPCPRCARPLNIKGKPRRGYCRSCYAVLSRKGELPSDAPRLRRAL